MFSFKTTRWSILIFGDTHFLVLFCYYQDCYLVIMFLLPKISIQDSTLFNYSFKIWWLFLIHCESMIKFSQSYDYSKVSGVLQCVLRLWAVHSLRSSSTLHPFHHNLDRIFCVYTGIFVHKFMFPFNTALLCPRIFI